MLLLSHHVLTHSLTLTHFFFCHFPPLSLPSTYCSNITTRHAIPTRPGRLAALGRTVPPIDVWSFISRAMRCRCDAYTPLTHAPLVHRTVYLYQCCFTLSPPCSADRHRAFRIASPLGQARQVRSPCADGHGGESGSDPALGLWPGRLSRSVGRTFGAVVRRSALYSTLLFYHIRSSPSASFIDIAPFIVSVP